MLKAVMGVAFAWVALNAQPGALDPAKVLIGEGASLQSEDVRQIFSLAFTANMRIPPEHLGVVFYDTRTGEELPHGEVRELIGPMRQEGALELMGLAFALAGGQYRLNSEQGAALMDAAFIASMHNPPKHISIEYYDLRLGPTGQGGGVSGRVPDSLEP